MKKDRLDFFKDLIKVGIMKSKIENVFKKVKEKEIEVGGPEVFTHNEIAELAFQVVNNKPKIKYMPEWMRKTILWFARTFTSQKTYGPMEFFFTVLAMDMVAPMYGNHKLKDFFEGIKKRS